jgi:Amidohydrolase
MWAQDYPHSEGTFGYTADALAEITDAVSDADARKILGGTALEIYKLNQNGSRHDRCTSTAAAGPSASRTHSQGANNG